MKYFSTFTGIGGFELGIGDKGECVGYSELDKYAVSIYQKHFPEHKNYGDITKIDADTIPDFDLLVGGFPCQAFSIAGKRKGFEDTRGTLFFDLARILRAKRPRLFVFENVKGLLSHDDGNTFRTIIGAIDELGYDCQWQVLNSKNHGVPQNRERVFIVGHLRGTARPEVFPFTGADGKDTRIVGQDVAYTIDANYHKGTNTLEKGRRSIVQVNNPKHSNDRVYGDSGVSPTLNTMQGGLRQPKILIPEATKKGFAEAVPGQAINLAVPNSKTRRGRVSDIAQTLDTGMQQHTLTNEARIRRLTPTECERLQGFPDGWTEGVSDTQRYKTLGNAVTTNVVKAIMEKLWNS
jgi:DNA (cytosine-5)-methyltransferase 1